MSEELHPEGVSPEAIEQTAADLATQEQKLPNRQTPFSEAFKKFIPESWDPYPSEMPPALPASGPAAGRRQAMADAFPGQRLVIPAGGLKVRNNDCDYPYRPDSAFAHLSGLGADREPDAVLVIEPDGSSVLYFKPRAPRTDPEFYADPRYGEMWVGQRESLAEMSALTAMECRPISELAEALGRGLPETTMRVNREADESINALVDDLRGGAAEDADKEFAVALSELRLVKDDFEVSQLRLACHATARGFEAVVRELPDAVEKGRGERWAEGVFDLYARHLGNDVGYSTIVASGDHANTLHWVRNTGDLRNGDLLLMDAGVEVDSLYTADVTRTLPISGRFTDDQREVYLAVLAAQEAGIEAAQAGARFIDVHNAAIRVVAERLEGWGILPVSADVSLGPDGGHHRRWMVHGTSHHLGLDVHDCARARNEQYREGTLKPGMVITVEPGIYFKATDQLVPDRFRGIGIRIEDDILITERGPVILSDGLPRHPDDVERWMGRIMPRRV